MSLKFDPNHNRHYRAASLAEEDNCRMCDILPTGRLPSWSWERWFFVGSAVGSILGGVVLGFWYQDWKAVLPGVGMALLSSLLAVMIDWDSD